MSITDCSNYSRYDLHMLGKPKIPPHVEFGKRFIVLCQEANLPNKQDKLGKELGVSGSFISSVRTGKKMPSFIRSVGWAEKMGVCVEYLLTGRGDKYPVNSPNDAVKSKAIELTRLLLGDLECGTLSDEAKDNINAVVNKQVHANMGTATTNTQPKHKTSRKPK